MKALLIAAVIGVGMLVAINLPTEQTYINVNDETTLEVVEEKEAWETDEDAINAAKAVIRKKELEAEVASTTAEIDALVKAHKEALTNLTNKKVELEKELGTFWRDAENVKRLIRETFPEEPTVALAVAKCESGFKPSAHNPANKDGTTDGGLWQINSVHDERLEQLGLNKYDPEDATKYARMLYDEQGWNPWVCYHKLAMR